MKPRNKTKWQKANADLANRPFLDLFWDAKELCVRCGLPHTLSNVIHTRLHGYECICGSQEWKSAAPGGDSQQASREGDGDEMRKLKVHLWRYNAPNLPNPIACGAPSADSVSSIQKKLVTCERCRKYISRRRTGKKEWM